MHDARLADLKLDERTSPHIVGNGPRRVIEAKRRRERRKDVELIRGVIRRVRRMRDHGRTCRSGVVTRQIDALAPWARARYLRFRAWQRQLLASRRWFACRAERR